MCSALLDFLFLPECTQVLNSFLSFIRMKYFLSQLLTELPKANEL